MAQYSGPRCGWHRHGLAGCFAPCIRPSAGAAGRSCLSRARFVRLAHLFGGPALRRKRPTHRSTSFHPAPVSPRHISRQALGCVGSASDDCHRSLPICCLQAFQLTGRLSIAHRLLDLLTTESAVLKALLLERILRRRDFHSKHPGLFEHTAARSIGAHPGPTLPYRTVSSSPNANAGSTPASGCTRWPSTFPRNWIWVLIGLTCGLAACSQLRLALLPPAFAIALLFHHRSSISVESYRVLCDASLLLGPLFYAVFS